MTSDVPKIEPEEQPDWFVTNPWDVKTVYNFQFFNCPECLFKVQEKQQFINHAFESHPESIGYLNSITDGSLADIAVPWTDCQVLVEPITDILEDVKLKIENGDDDHEFEDDGNYEPNEDIDFDDEDDNEDFEEESDEDIPLAKRPKLDIKRDPGSDVQCYCCGITTKFKNIKKHIFDHHGSYAFKAHMYGDAQPYHCFKCKGTFESQQRQDSHMCYDVKVPEKKKNSKTFDCVQCQNPFKCATSYRQHVLSVHNDDKPFKCKEVEDCEFRGKHNHDIIQHVKRVHKKAEASYLCQTCGKAYHHESALKIHVALVHEKKPKSEVMNKRPKPYQCNNCDRTFSTQGHLKQHQILHVDESSNSIKCNYCDSYFQTVAEYDEHVVKLHSEDAEDLGYYSCDQCQVSFCLTKILDLHYQIVHQERRWTCHICLKPLTNSWRLKQHIDGVHKGLKPYGGKSRNSKKCPFCDNWDIKTEMLKDHISRCHPNEPLPFMCDKCDHKTFNKYSLESHIKIMHTQKQEYICDQCDFVTNYANGIKRHVMAVHMNISAFQCHLCPKALKDSRSLKRHLVCKHQMVLSEAEMGQVLKDINRVVAIKPVEPKCDKCDRKCDTEEELNSHTKICYADIKREVEFKCNKCDTIWHAPEALHFHLYNTHKVGDDVCDICGQIVKNTHYLKKHKQSVHMQIKEWPCDQCGKLYSSKESMKRHIEVTHLGLRKWNCDLCDFKGRNAHTVNVHMKKVHSKDPMPFKCVDCDFAIDSDKKLRKHRSKFHPKERKPKIVIAPE